MKRLATLTISAKHVRVGDAIRTTDSAVWTPVMRLERFRNKGVWFVLLHTRSWFVMDVLNAPVCVIRERPES